MAEMQRMAMMLYLESPMYQRIRISANHIFQIYHDLIPHCDNLPVLTHDNIATGGKFRIPIFNYELSIAWPTMSGRILYAETFLFEKDTDMPAKILGYEYGSKCFAELVDLLDELNFLKDNLNHEDFHNLKGLTGKERKRQRQKNRRKKI